MNEDRSSRDRQRGQGLVELALILPMLVMIVMGSVDVGRVFFAYTSLVNAAREGAAFASLSPNATSSDVAAVVNAELTGSLPGSVTTTKSGDATSSSITVTVTYSFSALTTAVVSNTTIPLSVSATMVVQ